MREVLERNRPPMSCIVCDRPIKNCGHEDWNDASDAVLFMDGGNYGSSLYDSAFDGEHVELVVCDDCLTRKKEQLHRFKYADFDQLAAMRRDEALESLAEIVNEHGWTTSAQAEIEASANTQTEPSPCVAIAGQLFTIDSEKHT